MKSEWADLSPVGFGVPYEQVFTRVWHHVFGLVNRDLVARGRFIDPYAAGAPFVGFLPFVWDRSLSDAKPF